MSRRCHHGSPRHARSGRERGRPVVPERLTSERPAFERPLRSEPEPTAEHPIAAEPALRSNRPAIEARPALVMPNAAPEAEPLAEPEPEPERELVDLVEGDPLVQSEPAPPPARVPTATRERRSDGPRTSGGPRPVAPPGPAVDGEEGAVDRGATAPQLRRFIKSRAYVPMHELRRRFAINGADDDVTVVDVDRQRVYVGLPEREGRLLGELLRGGDIGYELSLDPISPIVVGVYPMRPVTRA